MFFSGAHTLPYRFQLTLDSVQQSDSLPFTDTLSQDQIQAVCVRHNVPIRDNEDQIYDPSTTLWGFLSQVIHRKEQRACLAAVIRIGKMLLVLCGRSICMNNSGAYCRARKELPTGVVVDLTKELAADCSEGCPKDWLWFGRQIECLDGTTVTMPDTAANQEAYPQLPGQKEGLGFPIARLVAVFSLATGMLKNLAMGPYQGKQTGETALLRTIMDGFRANSIVLMDKLFSNYWTIADFLARQVDVVTLHHASRTLDLSNATRLGPNDCVITWFRPGRPKWMDQAIYELIPKTLVLRIIQGQICKPGFRVQTVTIVTTLLNATKYRSDDVISLYRQRWNVELNIRAIKVQMGMDDLRCQTPDMVQKEIWTCMLAYNLIRLKLLQAAQKKGVPPLSLSFTYGLQTVVADWMLVFAVSPELQERLYEADLKGIGKRQVGNRPDRIEPRAVKRRPKPTPLLTMPRAEARSLQIATGVDPFKKQK